MENPGTGDDVAASKIADQATATAPPAETRQKQADQPAHDGHDSDSDSDLDELDGKRHLARHAFASVLIFYPNRRPR